MRIRMGGLEDSQACTTLSHRTNPGINTQWVIQIIASLLICRSPSDTWQLPFWAALAIQVVSMLRLIWPTVGTCQRSFIRQSIRDYKSLMMLAKSRASLKTFFPNRLTARSALVKTDSHQKVRTSSEYLIKRYRQLHQVVCFRIKKAETTLSIWRNQVSKMEGSLIRSNCRIRSTTSIKVCMMSTPEGVNSTIVKRSWNRNLMIAMFLRNYKMISTGAFH